MKIDSNRLHLDANKRDFVCRKFSTHIKKYLIEIIKIKSFHSSDKIVHRTKAHDILGCVVCESHRELGLLTQ